MGRGDQEAAGGAEVLFSAGQRRGITRALAEHGIAGCPHCSGGKTARGLPCTGVAHGRGALHRDDELLLAALRRAVAAATTFLPDAWIVGRRMQAQGRVPAQYIDGNGQPDARAISRRLRKLADYGWVEAKRGKDRRVFKLSEAGEHQFGGRR